MVATRRVAQRDGADGLTTATIAAEAGVSRGTLYHHFGSTEGIVAALYDDVSAQAVGIASRHSREIADPVDRLLAQCNAWLDAVRRPDIGGVLLRVGPQVLGWEKCREIEDRHALRALTAAIVGLTDEGLLEARSPTLLARILNAVIAELALDHADPDDAPEMLATIVNAYRRAGSVPGP